MDDFLISADTGNNIGNQCLKGIRDLYEWGVWESKSFTQCGARNIQSFDRVHGWGQITLDMEEYAAGIEEQSIVPARRRRPELPLLPAESTSLRSLLCQMLWLSAQACPLLSAPLIILLWHQPSATVGTVLAANKLLRRAKAWCRTPLVFHRHSSLAVVTFSDAAWKVRMDGTSQGGHVVFLVNQEALVGAMTPCRILSW